MDCSENQSSLAALEESPQGVVGGAGVQGDLVPTTSGNRLIVTSFSCFCVSVYMCRKSQGGGGLL